MRIGLVVNILDEEYQISVFRGASGRAAEKGIELICFQQEGPGLREDSFLSSFPEREFFGLDGIILLSSVLCDGCDMNVKSDIDRIWRNIPVVSVGQAIGGIPSLVIRSRGSMRSLVEHLILHHSYRKFVFIGGASRHHDTVEREQVFVDTVESFRGSFPDLDYTIRRGDFTENSAVREMTRYIEEGNGRVDAVVCANDNMAIGVYKVLKMKYGGGFGECAITGFDDIPQAELEIPPLTTIRQPIEEMGAFAVDAIERILSGGTEPEVSFFDARLVLRGSCGCSPSGVDGRNLSERQVSNILYKYLRSEEILRMVTRTVQEFNIANSFDLLSWYLRSNLELLDVRTFILLEFERHAPEVRVRDVGIRPLFLMRNGVRLESHERNGSVPAAEFFPSVFGGGNSVGTSCVCKFLASGDEMIGCVVYEARNELHPYMCSMIASLAQTLDRLNSFEEKKRRSEYLESEVSKRTKELMDANARRIEVEAQVLRISELERQRFSTDLHDDICQRLAGISMLCRSYSAGDAPVGKEQMAELASLISETLQCTRQYAHDSYPVELESLGMNRSLSNLCNSFSRQSGIRCVYEWDMTTRHYFDKMQKLNIFRIIQEALHNVMKHAQATEVIVSIRETSGGVVIKVSDNGCGLGEGGEPDKDGIQGKKGLGLSSMQYRADQIGATFEIYWNHPSGTCVELVLPQNSAVS